MAWHISVRSCFSLALVFAASLPLPVYAQSTTITVDSSAQQKATIGKSAGGKPTVNIVTPNSGVSTNKFTNFQVGKDGLILNNSSVDAVSKTGGAVTANPNLKTSGAANVIVNQVRGDKSKLQGKTEVVGTKAKVIVANPNGIECDGCSFINTNGTTLTTGTLTQIGSGVGIAVTGGTVSVGRGGATSEGDLTLSGRHVLVDGATNADGTLSVYGGTHSVDPVTGLSSSAPIQTTRVLPYAVDATEFGAMSGGNIRIIGNESGLGVRALGDIKAKDGVTIRSAGSTTVQNVRAGGSVEIKAVETLKQFGDVEAGTSVTLGGKDVYIPGGRSVKAGTTAKVDATSNATIGGTINASSVAITSTANTQNTGSLSAVNGATVTAGGNIINTREKFTVYEGQEWADAWLKSYEAVFKEWGISEDPDLAYWGNEYFTWTTTKIVDQYLLKGGSIVGADVSLKASGSITNEAGSIVSVKDTILQAKLDVLNISKATTNKIGADEGCGANIDCGTRQNFHASEILAGGNLSITGRNITNSASTIAAFGDVAINASATIRNYALSTSYVTKDFESETSSKTTYDRRQGYYDGKQRTITYQTDVFTSSSTATQSTDFDYAPGIIRSLTGSATLKATGSYLAVGSSLRAAKAVSIEAGGQIKLASQAGINSTTTDEQSTTKLRSVALVFTSYVANQSTSSTRTVQTDREQTSNVSEIIAENILLTSGGDLISTGSQLVAKSDLKISAGGSVVFDGGSDLLGTDNGEFAVNLRNFSNLANTLRTDSAVAKDYAAYLNADSLTEALTALHIAGNGTVVDGYADKVGATVDVSTFQQNQTVYRAEQVLQAYRSFFRKKYRWVTVYVPEVVSVTHAKLSVSEGADNISEALTGLLDTRFGAAASDVSRLGDDVVNATGFDYAAMTALVETDDSTRTILEAGGNLEISAREGDIVASGGTVAHSGAAMKLAAKGDIALLSLRNTGLGDGGDILARQEDFRAGFMYPTETASAQIRTLSPVSLISGGATTLSAGNDVNNFGASVVAGSDLVVSAGRDIQNDVIRYYYTLTAADGCQNSACGLDGHAFRAGEMLAGSGMILQAGRDVLNIGSNVGAAGSIIADAGNDIRSEALTSQFLINYLNQKKKFFGITYQTTKIIENFGFIQDASIASEFGDVSLKATRDILLNGSALSAGATVNGEAGRDIKMASVAEEITNYTSKSGIIGFGIGSQKRNWNGFVTAFPTIEANDIALNAGNNLSAIGSKLVSADEIALSAGNDLTFDAQQNHYYDRSSGWYIGFSAPALDILSAAFKGDGKQALAAYVNQNPLLAAVHSLATGSGTSTLGSALKVATAGARLLAGARADALGGQMGASAALLAQFNPANGLNLDPFSLIKGKGASPLSLLNQCSANAKDCAFLSGISFRLSVWRSSQEWTESTVSRLLAGTDMVLSAGRDVSLVGGTYASAGKDATVVAGRNIGLTAVADTVRTSSSSWGLTFGLTQSGFTVGGDMSRNSSNAVTYSNAFLGAGGHTDLIAGQDVTLAGANVTAKSVSIDAGRDLLLVSQQNQYTADGRSFSLSVSFTGGVPTGASIGGSLSKARRTYTDTPTTIVADDELDVYVGRNTVLAGAGLWSKTNKLSLDTGDLAYDNYVDKDLSLSASANLSIGTNLALWRGSASAQYKNITGLTYATLGTGKVTVRNRPLLDYSALNADPANMQRIVSKKSFAFEIPELNPVALLNDIRDARSFLNTLAANIPLAVREKGQYAQRAWERLLLNGLTPSQAGSVVQTELFGAITNQLKSLDEIRAAGRTPDQYDLLLLAQGETLLFGKASNYAGGSIVVVCPTLGTCQVSLDEYKKKLKADPELFQKAIIKLLSGALPIGQRPTSGDAAAVNWMIGEGFNAMLRCSISEPEVFAKFIGNSEWVDKPKGFDVLVATIAAARNIDIDSLKSFNRDYIAKRATTTFDGDLIAVMEKYGLDKVLPSPGSGDPRLNGRAQTADEVFDLIFIGGAGVKVAGRIAADAFLAGFEDVLARDGATAAQRFLISNGVKLSDIGQLHHILTNKNFVKDQAWSLQFEEILTRAGMTFNDDANLIYVLGHVGPHPQEYHAIVAEQLRMISRDLSQEAYKNEVKLTLKNISREIVKSGSRLNQLISR